VLISISTGSHHCNMARGKKAPKRIEAGQNKGGLDCDLGGPRRWCAGEAFMGYVVASR
jgi:hypothetical protein